MAESVKDHRTHEVKKIEALVRYHFKVDPDTLSDDKLGRLWGDLRYALEIEKMRTGNKPTL